MSTAEKMKRALLGYGGRAELDQGASGGIKEFGLKRYELIDLRCRHDYLLGIRNLSLPSVGGSRSSDAPCGN